MQRRLLGAIPAVCGLSLGLSRPAFGADAKPSSPAATATPGAAAPPPSGTKAPAAPSGPSPAPGAAGAAASAAPAGAAPSGSAAATASPSAPPSPSTPNAAPSAPPGPAGDAPAPGEAAAAPPPEGPPPQYYVEPQGPGAPTAEGIYEPPPPPPVYEPPPPAPPHNRAPRTALWVGARLAWFVPFGSLWIDGFSGPSGVYFRRRTFASYASTGPAGELDLGVRLARHYLVFALFEHASLGTGSLEEHSFGGQERGSTNLYGLGLRFSTDPGNVGFALEVALGYRDFRAYWSDGTKLEMTGGVLDARLGLGADIRVSRLFSLSPMIALGGGSFSSGRFTGPSGAHDVQTQFDQAGEYGTLALQLGGHFDIY